MSVGRWTLGSAVFGAIGAYYFLTEDKCLTECHAFLNTIDKKIRNQNFDNNFLQNCTFLYPITSSLSSAILFSLTTLIGKISYEILTRVYHV